MEHPATDLLVPNLVGDMQHVTTPRESSAPRKELKTKRSWFTQVEWIQCGGCLNQQFPVALRPGWTATSILNWCEASECGNGVGWTPKKIFWRKLVACWTRACAAEREKKSREFSTQKSLQFTGHDVTTTWFSPGKFKIFEMKVNSFAMAKTTFFSKTLKALARFSPRRVHYDITFCSQYCSYSHYTKSTPTLGVTDPFSTWADFRDHLTLSMYNNIFFHFSAINFQIPPIMDELVVT